MDRYVVGLHYVTKPDVVLLIRKTRPEWQNGKLNGVGGHIEIGESPIEAMRREFREEAALDILAWRKFLVLSNEFFHITFFAHKGKRIEMPEIKSMTDEKLEWHPVRPLPDDTIPNLRWIVPLGLEMDLEEHVVAKHK